MGDSLAKIVGAVLLGAVMAGFPAPAAAGAAACAENEPALQVLGSGGPVADDGRASSGYLLWADGRARVLIDAGGGIFLRFGEAGATLDELDLIAITHLHTDHVADLPALLKGAYFSDRERILAISGPDGAGRFPGIEPFLNRLFDAQGGAFGYLAGLLDGSEGMFGLQAKTVAHASDSPVTVRDRDGLRIEAIGVHHGPVPTLAYRLSAAGRRIVVSGDQNLDSPGFLEFTRDADLLVMPFPIPESAGKAAATLHARPSKIAGLATGARVRHLVLSHFMARSLKDRDVGVARVRADYKGRLTLARDLQCIPLP
ncbi:MBL fold metallo-hydrolase [Elongatibacter sediminis]|uniref:MBL fold metallo-hydrolase n=1 Tax=Elongatibacter sediminis TaxID=3119006 RepID=A0AAW9RC77_9GAMM